jgi:hypothetical protein
MADANVVKEASNVITSENATTFYAERLGLADSIEPTEAVEPTEPAQDLEQSEPEAEEEAKEIELEKPKDKLNKRFEKVSKRAQDAEAKAAELENRLRELESRVNPQQEQVQEQPVQDDGKPNASQFDDAFEYAEALAKWSADNALKQRDAQDAQRKMQDSWKAKLDKAKAEYDDWDDVVPKSKVVVRDEIRDSILESDVGPQILYALASDDDYANELAAMPVMKALKEIGKLEARFEAQAEKPVAKAVQETVSRSKAPSPIKPLTGGRAGADVLVDTNGEFMGTPSQWKAARLAGKIR